MSFWMIVIAVVIGVFLAPIMIPILWGMVVSIFGLILAFSWIVANITYLVYREIRDLFMKGIKKLKRSPRNE